MMRIRNEANQNFTFPFGGGDDYYQQPVCFKDCEDHYELIYTGDFESVGKESAEVTKLMRDLKDGDKDTELWIYINSYGGDVSNLSMILQQVLQYQHRVTVCAGSAMSAGFILWACGHERYVSPYSELMYHSISSGYAGKGHELSTLGSHIEKVTAQLMEAVRMGDLISEEDMKTGLSTEVWYTGADFIASGKARDYSEFLNRAAPLDVVVTLAGGRFFAKSGDDYVELLIDAEHRYGYMDLMEIERNAGEAGVDPELAEEVAEICAAKAEEERKDEEEEEEDDAKKPRKRKPTRRKKQKVDLN